ARAGIITTAGLRDVLEMRRRDRPRTWGLRGTFEPIVDRRDRLEVPERTLANSDIRVPVDLEAVEQAARRLLEAGCDAVAILFANAYANPDNERRAAEVVRALWPNPHVTTSAEILPEIREFERFSTAALNAYLQPEVSGYVQRLDAALRGRGFAGEFLIVQSNGGVMSAETACKVPVRTALSGPAAGVMAAGYIASEAGMANVITGDMGGTSFDVSLIVQGRSVLSAQTSIDFGMVVRTPMIEITTIGAGGGSIAWVDRGGLLHIGPESAGSDPGPVAYGLGNDRPTVTDAQVVLGRIDAANPIGGKLDALDVEAATRAIEQHVGAPLGLNAIDAAEAILRVANSKLAGAVRLVSIERGHDPTQFAFMPFGGGGGLHACAMLRDVGLARALVPRYPGVTSAMGCVIADMRHDFVQTVNTTLEGLDTAQLRATMQAHVDHGLAILNASQSRFASHETHFELDMAYAGQTHTLAVSVAVEVADGRVDRISPDTIGVAFDDAYRQRFGRLLEGGVRRIVNLRSAIIGRRPKFDLTSLVPSDTRRTVEQARKTSRRVHVGDAWYEAAVYDRLALPVGGVIRGPAILEQADTTVLIEPGMAGRVDAYGNTVIEPEELS
ncbi:MAG: hydantoinase/oxoprolinase family protein, partial [Pseudomonadota bacterium]